MNILLLDDEPLELEQLQFLIQKRFPTWKLFLADTGSLALELADEYKFQLAFVDIKLRGRSGLEVAEHLRKKSSVTDIVIVSAFQDFAYAKQSIQIGVLDYMVKPVMEDELDKVLGLFVDKHPSVGVSDLIKRVLERIHQDYAVRLSLEELSKELHVHLSYLSRRFSEEMGTSFSEYLIQYRIEVAKRLMIEQRDWSLSRITEESGFNTAHYFSKMFKKVTSQTPKEYRYGQN